MHARQAIRAEAAALVTGLATAGASVYTTRFFPLEQTQLPCWIVTTDAEDAELVTMGAGYERVLELTFTAVAREATGAELEAILDTMALELETALFSHAWANAREVIYRGLELTADVDETDRAIGALLIRFAASYDTDGPAST